MVVVVRQNRESTRPRTPFRSGSEDLGAELGGALGPAATIEEDNALSENQGYVIGANPGTGSRASRALKQLEKHSKTARFPAV